MFCRITFLSTFKGFDVREIKNISFSKNKIR